MDYQSFPVRLLPTRRTCMPLLLLLLLLLLASGIQAAFVPADIGRPRRTLHQDTKGTTEIDINAAGYSDSAVSPLTLHMAQQTAGSEAPSMELATADQIMTYGEEVGVKVSLTTLGPGYRAVARATHDEEQIIGYVEGFLRPGGKILHLDKMEVWKKAVDRARKENPEGYKNGGNVLGVGLLLGYLCLLHGLENGCTTAEFLAIDDEEYQHKRLVRYYQLSGFKVIRYVGEDMKDIPDRLIWGGCGTLMREEIMVLLQKWTKSLFGKDKNQS